MKWWTHYANYLNETCQRALIKFRDALKRLRPTAIIDQLKFKVFWSSPLFRNHYVLIHLLQCLFEMGNICSCQKKTRLSDSDPKFCAVKTRTTAESGQLGCPSTGMVKANSTKEVTNSDNQKDAHAEMVKEYKVLPPIRKRGDTLPHISYTPNRVWGGSVHSFLATVNQDSGAIDDLITGKTKGVATKCLKRCYDTLVKFLLVIPTSITQR